MFVVFIIGVGVSGVVLVNNVKEGKELLFMLF